MGGILRRMRPGDEKLRWGIAAYAVLAALAGLTLRGPFRVAVLILLAGLAVKTWIGILRDGS
jgi:hypothetical protein